MISFSYDLLVCGLELSKRLFVTFRAKKAHTVCDNF